MTSGSDGGILSVEPASVGRLLNGAADAFAAKGYHATATRDIASRAGMSAAGVYVHFPSKEALLFRLCLLGHTSARDSLLGAEANANGPADALRAVTSTFASWHAREHQMARVVQYEFAHMTAEHRDEVSVVGREIDEIFCRIVHEGVQSGVFAQGAGKHQARAVQSLCIDVARWYRPTSKRSPQQIGVDISQAACALVGSS